MALATAEDVAIRLGRDLTEAEQGQVEQAIESVTAQIADVVDRDADWLLALDPIPVVLRTLCIDKAVTVVVNPTNLASESKQIGTYSKSQTFQRSADAGVFLTESEKRGVRGILLSRMRSVTIVTPYSERANTSIAENDLVL